MKPVLIIALLLQCIYTFSQVEKIKIVKEKPERDNSVISSAEKEFVYPEVMPEYVGGYYAMNQFIMANLVYPQKARDEGISGTCYLRFIVSEIGKLDSIIVAKGVTGCSECDTEAIRLLKLMPNWIPRSINGVSKKCYFLLPFKFKIQ